MSVTIPLANRDLPPDCLIFKHSTTCPISAQAAHEVAHLSIDLPVYQVNVREQRELSTWVASTYGVVHESPQVILVGNGVAVRSWSHGQVRREVIEREIANRQTV